VQDAFFRCRRRPLMSSAAIAAAIALSLVVGVGSASAATSSNCSWLTYSATTSHTSPRIIIDTFDHGGWSGWPDSVNIPSLHGWTMVGTPVRNTGYYETTWTTSIGSGFYTTGIAHTNGTDCKIDSFTVT
jgi:uncharacterized protein YbdZ (MbtH family)